MKTCRRASLRCFLLILVFACTSDGLFFHSPHNLLTNLVNSLIGHKQMKPMVHHHHTHYYPVPVPVMVPKITSPPKIEIDLSSLHSGHDWANQHEPDLALPPPHPDAGWASPIPEAWPDSSVSQQKSSWGWDNNEILEKDQVYKEAKPPGILLQVPLKQQIVLYHPPTKDTKSSLLSIFLKKLRRLSNALLHPEEEEHHDQQIAAPHITNSLHYGGP